MLSKAGGQKRKNQLRKTPDRHYYPRDIIKGRWPEGEEAIKKNPGWAYRYSRDVIKGRSD
jgi:hypothetical protein